LSTRINCGWRERQLELAIDDLNAALLSDPRVNVTTPTIEIQSVFQTRAILKLGRAVAKSISLRAC